MAHHVCISRNEWIHNTLFHCTLYTAATATAAAMIHCRLYSSFRRNTSGKRSELCAFVFDSKFTSKRLLRLFWLVQSNNDDFAYIYICLCIYMQCTRACKCIGACVYAFVLMILVVSLLEYVFKYLC